jgi:hypothetical protein
MLPLGGERGVNTLPQNALKINIVKKLEITNS